MKKLFYLICCLLASLQLSSQGGIWVWMNGSDLPDAPASYGTKGVSSPTNTPPVLYESVSWKDLQGNLWIYGGHYSIGNGAIFQASCLWKYDISTNEWTWINGDAINNAPANYGIKGVPSPTNTPGFRTYGAQTWTDLNGDLWLFSGVSSAAGGLPADLWKYNIASNQWTWMSGSNNFNDKGFYGSLGIPSPANYPPPRCENACTWTDSSNNLWLFGGSGTMGNLNDVWKYNISTNEWSWHKGAQFDNAQIAPDYGIIGTENTSNNPGSRWVYSAAYDGGSNTYIFGGKSSSELYSDVWKYNMNSNNWTWVGGSKSPNDNGVYNAYCDSLNINFPSGRYETRATCGDQNGMWIFGGFCQIQNKAYSANDLWHYCYASNTFEWLSGSQNEVITGNFGTKGIPSPSSYPPGLAGSNAWLDDQGNYWLFGGWGTSRHNTLWKFIPDKNCLSSCTNKKDNSNEEDDEIKLFVPNVFTPNTDGQNDVFEIVNKGYDEFSIKIFDRWGILMFETKDKTVFWNGKLLQTGNEAAPGTYYYILNLREEKSKATHVYAGYLTLMR